MLGEILNITHWAKWMQLNSFVKMGKFAVNMDPEAPYLYSMYDEKLVDANILIRAPQLINIIFLKYKKIIKSIKNILNPLSLIVMPDLGRLGLAAMSNPRYFSI